MANAIAWLQDASETESESSITNIKSNWVKQVILKPQLEGTEKTFDETTGDWKFVKS